MRDLVRTVPIALLALGVLGPLLVLGLHELGMRRLRRAEGGPRRLLGRFVREYVLVDGGDLVRRADVAAGGVEDSLTVWAAPA